MTTPEKLMPCPFCGQNPDPIAPDKLGIWCFCVAHGDDMTKPSIEEWNNAYCWQQLCLAREALTKIANRKQYSCDCEGGDPCSCDFSFMQYEAEKTLAKMGEVGK